MKRTKPSTPTWSIFRKTAKRSQKHQNVFSDSFGSPLRFWKKQRLWRHFLTKKNLPLCRFLSTRFFRIPLRNTGSGFAKRFLKSIRFMQKLCAPLKRRVLKIWRFFRKCLTKSSVRMRPTSSLTIFVHRKARLKRSLRFCPAIYPSVCILFFPTLAMPTQGK